MKIVNRGTPPQDNIWSGKCNTCGTLAEAKEPELRITRSQRDGDFAWARCPVCKTGSDDYGGVLFYKTKKSEEKLRPADPIHVMSHVKSTSGLRQTEGSSFITLYMENWQDAYVVTQAIFDWIELGKK